VLQATGEVVGFADADLSSGPDDIVRVFACVDSGEADLAVASRTDPASTIAGRQPFLRRTSGWAYNLLLKALGLTAMSDTQCGLKASTATAARALYGPLSTRRFAFDVEVVARAERLGLRIAEVPVTWSHVEASRVRPVRDGLRAVGDAVRIRRIVGR
jgi:dolichyl-phosphate beta-glucosyltransferase